ncbi:Hpt domain-containing protein [Eggerthella sp. YY7918]|uniref:Hpt domain-containing protein n=1 Tax=Eggerthella sp. (strain YY7918) TaxID=502558 RepID=UPI0002170F5E|nr:Hpt domain-containing protein [Eggerthella sp. YY7918]BAK43749.1 Hpt domain-containing protein [Eggerthella sp. YY7918]
MDTISEQLTALGVDIEPTLKRFYGDCDLLVEMLHEFAREDLAEQLPEALSQGDYTQIELIAHSVKGTSANLGLVELSNRCNDAVQAVRAGTFDDMDKLVNAVVEQYRTVRAGISQL